MSPPTKLPLAPDLDRRSEVPETGPGATIHDAAPAMAPLHAAVLGGQRTAGNRAMAAVLGAPLGVQRAPREGDPRTSGVAPASVPGGSSTTRATQPGYQSADPGAAAGVAPAPTPGGGITTGATQPGYQSADPGAAAGVAMSPTPGAGDVAMESTLPGGVGPLQSPAPAPTPAPVGRSDTIASSGDDDGGAPTPPQGRRIRGPSHGLTDNSIAAAHKANPTSVHRAINWTWYAYILHQQKFAVGDYPRGIRVRDSVVVAPNYDGPGVPPRTTPIEEPDPDGHLGSDDPVPGDPRLMQGPRQQMPDLSDPNAKRAVFPGSRRGAEPGMKAAVPLTHDEVIRAYRQNPASVHPSDSDDWHDQIFAMDRGQGQSPRAYRSGNTIIVDPSYPLDGRPPDASPRGSMRRPGPGSDLGTVLNPAKSPMSDPRKANIARTDAKRPGPPAPVVPPAPGPDPTQSTQTISPTGYVPQERKPAKWSVKGGELSREIAREEKRVTDQSTDTKVKSSKTSYGIAKGAGLEREQRDESQAGEKFTAKERSNRVNASLAGLGFNRGSATETGTAPDGPKARSEKNVGGSVGPDGLTGTASRGYTTQSGTKAEATGDVKLGPDGIELAGTGSITTPKGFTGHLSVSGKSNVVARDPKPMPSGKFAVEFVMTDENGVELGGGWSKPGGGMSVAVNVGTSSSSSQFETRVFDSQAEAILFQMTAAARVSSESHSIARSTTSDGALALKEGEVRGSSKTETDTIGGSAGVSQVSLGVASTDSTTTGLKIERMAGSKVRVTPSIAEQEALNATISVGGKFGNTKGKSETNSFSVTYEFDLGSPGGKQAYDTYLTQRLPPPMPPHAKWIDSTTGHQMEDHDVYKFAHVGEIGWGSHATQQTVEDEGGRHTTASGGTSEKVELNAIRKLTLDKNRHSEADIVGRMTNGQITQIAGQMTVGGEDGSFNREQFRRIFTDKGAPAGTEVASSGEWTLSAEIDKKVFEDLEKSNDDMRKAKTREERLKIYSQLAQKGGAEMLMGQVRRSGKKLAWNLELKGDPNFPGAAGRAKLNEQRRKLAAQLKDKPESAGSVAADAKDALGALAKRLTDVSNKKKYTDLPDELRTEQVDLINTHIAEFKSLRSQALSVHMRGGRKEDLTVVLRRAADEQGYNDVPIGDRAWRKAQDLVTIHETEISVLEAEIAGTRNVVQRMFTGKGDVRWAKGVHVKVFQAHNENAKQHFATFRAQAPRLTEAVGKMRALKERWSAEPDPKARENLLREYDAFLLAAIQIMSVQLTALRDATRDAYVVTSERLVGNAAFAKLWETVNVDKIARDNAVAGLDDSGSAID